MWPCPADFWKYTACSWDSQAWRHSLAWECLFQWYFPCPVSLPFFQRNLQGPLRLRLHLGRELLGVMCPSLSEARCQINQDKSGFLPWHLILSSETWCYFWFKPLSRVFAMAGEISELLENSSTNYFILRRIFTLILWVPTLTYVHRVHTGPAEARRDLWIPWNWS